MHFPWDNMLCYRADDSQRAAPMSATLRIGTVGLPHVAPFGYKTGQCLVVLNLQHHHHIRRLPCCLGYQNAALH